LKLSRWDIHLPQEVQEGLKPLKGHDPLSLRGFEDIVESSEARRAVLGGGEPTVDRHLPDIVRILSSYGVETVLLTNAHALNRNLIRKLKSSGLKRVYVSIKARSEEIHRFYTGESNKIVLENFRHVYEDGLELAAESILIPELVERDEIEKIAKFISSVDDRIHYRVDGFIPTPYTPWRKPTVDEVIEAAEVAKKYLKNVHYLHNKSDAVGKTLCIYPKITF